METFGDNINNNDNNGEKSKEKNQEEKEKRKEQVKEETVETLQDFMSEYRAWKKNQDLKEAKKKSEKAREDLRRSIEMEKEQVQRTEYRDACDQKYNELSSRIFSPKDLSHEIHRIPSVSLHNREREIFIDVLLRIGEEKMEDFCKNFPEEFTSDVFANIFSIIQYIDSENDGAITSHFDLMRIIITQRKDACVEDILKTDMIKYYIQLYSGETSEKKKLYIVGSQYENGKPIFHTMSYDSINSRIANGNYESIGLAKDDLIDSEKLSKFYNNYSFEVADILKDISDIDDPRINDEIGKQQVLEVLLDYAFMQSPINGTVSASNSALRSVVHILDNSPEHIEVLEKIDKVHKRSWIDMIRENSQNNGKSWEKMTDPKYMESYLPCFQKLLTLYNNNKNS